MLFVSSKKLFLALRYLNFDISSFSLYPPVSHCSKRWPKINLKVYDVISWLNKNLKTHIVCCLEEENKSDIETYWKILKDIAENVHQKLVPDPIVILVNSLNSQIYARDPLENKLFWKRIIKKTRFFLCAQYLLMDKIMKTKRCLELVTTLFLCRKTCLEKFLLLWSIT